MWETKARRLRLVQLRLECIRLDDAGRLVRAAGSDPDEVATCSVARYADGFDVLFSAEAEDDLVPRLAGPGDDVERIRGTHRVRAAVSHHSSDPVGLVSRHMGDQGAAVFAKDVEELAQGVLVPARCGPDQPAGVMTDHDRQIVVDLNLARIHERVQRRLVFEADPLQRRPGPRRRRGTNQRPDLSAVRTKTIADAVVTLPAHSITLLSFGLQ